MKTMTMSIDRAIWERTYIEIEVCEGLSKAQELALVREKVYAGDYVELDNQYLSRVSSLDTQYNFDTLAEVPAEES